MTWKKDGVILAIVSALALALRFYMIWLVEDGMVMYYGMR